MKKVALLLMLFAGLSLQARAWGWQGHEIVATMAYRLLDRETRQKLMDYMGPTTVPQTGTWMDEVNGKRGYDYMKTWHYIHMEKWASWKPTKEADIINALSQVTTELKYRKTMDPEAVKTDLLVLIHLMGDLSQPLHCGYGSDKGGEAVQVTVDGRAYNLHSLWDEGLVREAPVNINDCSEYYNTISPFEIMLIQKGNYVDWMNESRALLPKVYDTGGGEISPEYIMRSKKIIVVQLVNSAVRLANILQGLLSN
ncbi:MAG: hypothetical protein BGO69_12385 [Bacteroidetes bacterium 46-16]|nr:MAG: hypothetical protein BGO69_12385 [Bacteroidetes bacterium 46-16]